MDIKAKIKGLAPDIKLLLKNDDLVVSIFTLADEMHITDLQALEVEDATTKLLIGDLPPGKFLDALTTSGISAEKATSLARAIISDIVSGVESSIKEMYHVSGPLLSAIKTSAPAASQGKPPVAPTQQPKPSVPTPPKVPQPPQAAPSASQASLSGPSKTFQKDLARAKSGLPPVPMMTPPVKMERPEIPQPTIKAPARPPENLPGSPRPQIISSGKTGPSDSEPAPENIRFPKNAFEEKLQRTVGGSQQQEKGSSSSPRTDPYREPLE